MGFADQVRNVDRRPLVAYGLALLGLVVALRSTTTRAVDGVVTSCTSRDWADVILGLAAVALAVVAAVTVPRGGVRANRMVAAAAVVAGLALLPTGLGWIGGPCEGGDAVTPAIVLLAGVAVAAAITSNAGAEPVAAVSTIDAGGPAGPDLSAGLQRCRSCAFSSNPLDVTACRVCGSTDLQSVVPTGRTGAPPRP